MSNQERNEVRLKTTAPLVRKVGILIHVVIWAVPLCVPFFFTGRGGFVMTQDFFLRNCVVVSSFAVVFYANYLYLIKRFLSERKTGWFALLNFLLMAVTMLLVHLVMQLLPPPPEIPEREAEVREWIIIAGFLLRNLIMYSVVVVLSVAIRMTGNWFEMEAMRKDLEKSRAEAELRNLKSQLNPHFLFNTLNNIYSLIALSPEQAQGIVHELSRLLRYVLYESSHPHVSVGKDLDFIRNYIELMRIRLAGNVTLETAIEIENAEAQIAPLLFIALIENAFKHGVSNNKPSFVRINIRQKEGAVQCEIENSFFPKDQQDKSGSGIGLPNLEKRLALLYPGMYTFRHGREGDSYRSVLSITL